MAAKRQTRGVHRRRAATVDVALAAWELRAAGKSLRQIAAELKLSGPQQASNVLERGFTEFYSPKVEQRRAESEEMLRTLLSSLLVTLRGKKTSPAARLETIDRILKVDRELRLIHGVNAPTRTEITGKDGGPVMTTSLDITTFSYVQLEQIARGDYSGLASASDDGDPPTG